MLRKITRALTKDLRLNMHRLNKYFKTPFRQHPHRLAACLELMHARIKHVICAVFVLRTEKKQAGHCWGEAFARGAFGIDIALSSWSNYSTNKSLTCTHTHRTETLSHAGWKSMHLTHSVLSCTSSSVPITAPHWREACTQYFQEFTLISDQWRLQSYRHNVHLTEKFVM